MKTKLWTLCPFLELDTVTSLIYNSHLLERTQMLLNRRIHGYRVDTEILVHLNNGVKNNELMNFLGKSMYLEDNILSVVIQSQKNTYDMY